MQHDPKYILNILAELNQNDVCYVKYKKRKHNYLKIFVSKLNNYVSSFLMKKTFNIYTSSFKCFRKEISDKIIANDESFIFSGANLSGSQAATGSFGVLETLGNVNVTTTGRLGVGTDDPDFKLDVAGNAGFNEYIRHNGDNDTHIRFQANQVDISAGGNIYSYDGAAFNLTGHLSASGNISGSQIEARGDIIAFGSSDRNLKDNIQPIENPLEKMEKIGGYTFVWNDKQSTYQGKDVGVVAQEIQEVLPEIVSGRANWYLGVKYEKIVPLLIESIKENTKKIKELEQEINEINKNCDCLSK